MRSCLLLITVVCIACGSSKSDADDKSVDKGTATSGGTPASSASSANDTKSTDKAAGKSAATQLTRVAVDPAALAQGEWADKLLGIAVQHDSCEGREPAMKTLATEAEAAGQSAWAGLVLASAAYCQAERDALDEAVATLTRAVELGYTDCFFLRTDEHMKKLGAQPEMAALLDRIPISAADMNELAWQIAEVQAIFHDTNMMIMENMNRVDGEQTAVPQSTLPSWQSRDPSVLTGRLFLAAVQAYQRAIVLQSDQSRVSHLVNMNIIDNMGTGGTTASPARVQQSEMIARQAAQARAQQVEARAFADTGASTDVVACSSIPD